MPLRLVTAGFFMPPKIELEDNELNLKVNQYFNEATRRISSKDYKQT